MIAIVTVLIAFPAGYFLKSHLAANTLYAVAYLWAFVFQGVYLMLDLGNDGAAFSVDAFPWDYGAGRRPRSSGPGFALVAAGRWVRRGVDCSGRTATASVVTAG